MFVHARADEGTIGSTRSVESVSTTYPRYAGQWGASPSKARVWDAQVGWEDDAVVLAGLSFGGGVAQHYALHYPDHVERMVLLGSVGSPEPTWRPIPFFIRTLGWLNSLLLFPRNPEVRVLSALLRFAQVRRILMASEKVENRWLNKFQAYPSKMETIGIPLGNCPL